MYCSYVLYTCCNLAAFACVSCGVCLCVLWALQHCCNTMQLQRHCNTATHADTPQHTQIHCNTHTHNHCNTTATHLVKIFKRGSRSGRHDSCIPRLLSSHSATHTHTLQHTPIHCNTYGDTATHEYTATHTNTLQHTPIHCNTHGYTAQHAQIHCNITATTLQQDTS